MEVAGAAGVHYRNPVDDFSLVVGSMLRASGVDSISIL